MARSRRWALWSRLWRKLAEWRATMRLLGVPSGSRWRASRRAPSSPGRTPTHSSGRRPPGCCQGGPRGAVGGPLRPPRPRVDPHHALEGRGAVWNPGGLAGMSLVQQAGEEAAEALVAVVVAGEADAALDRAVAEVDAEHGAHAVLAGEPGKIRAAGGAVHVGEGQARHARRLRFGEEFLRAQDAVAEAEPRMGVQEHGGGKRRGFRRGCLGRSPIRGPGVCALGIRPCRTSPATGGVRSRTPGRCAGRWVAAGWCR